LGETGYQVEVGLQRLFRLAQAWGCVLLLDEADVFLAERTLQDMKRNGIVSGEKSSNSLIRPTADNICSLSSNGGVLRGHFVFDVGILAIRDVTL
jgi:hypothetical protein